MVGAVSSVYEFKQGLDRYLAAKSMAEYAESLQWFERAAGHGAEAAHEYIGAMYMGGVGTDVNDEKAFAAFALAVQAEGHSDVSEYALGELYLHGRGTPTNEPLAVHWLSKSAQQGNRDAARLLGPIFLRRGLAETNPEKSFARVLQAAQLGVPAAMARVGLWYRQGRGVAQNHEKAIEWYEKGATKNDLDAQYNLAVLLAAGTGTTRDTVRSLALYRVAAAAGHPFAQNNLGELYRNGTGVPLDREEAISWYKKSAAQNQPVPMFNIAEIYRRGEGLPQDLPRARRWMTKSAELGFAEAQFSLARMLTRGQGGPKDVTAANRWRNAALAQGYTPAVDEGGK